ncbi:hypothetical protein ALC53_03818 [Atta colombica]|uniref:Uncharacterized protein n=1 Tax=Atta colombica TaxID=520822 RepID=A0A195BN71_9HYME|nr:hypothetical protein ALC53_03818 [Atta colombica]
MSKTRVKRGLCQIYISFGGLPIGLIAPTEHCGHFTDSPNIQWGFTDLTLAVKAGGLRIEHSSSAVGSLAD